MTTEYQKLADLLEKVMDGTVSCKAAQDAIEELDWEDLNEVSALFGNLYHYWHDEDAREKDPAYRSFQNEELCKLVSHLRKRDYVRANEVSFLHTS